MKNELAFFGGDKVLNNTKPHFTWPIIDIELEKEVLNQLRDSISIYNKSGIFKSFEDSWSNYHQISYSLVVNSGTSALYSAFFGLGLKEGDEVICPNYTFFATISPAISLGVIPVYCDCDSNGNIDSSMIEALITEKTKAIVITHMWGVPCEMDKILRICSDYNIPLIEDCSHAHGAKYKGKLVGSFGIASAWSLQGKKIISGGEGGILSTKSDKIYHRALLLGHYNKRCKDEIPYSSPLKKYSVTGFGHKLRAHPIAIRIAFFQFKNIEKILSVKRNYASLIYKELDKIPFLRLPDISNTSPSWYAFVMQYNESKANGVTRDTFVKLLHAEGLIEVDIPNSTSPIYHLPLFQEKKLAFYSETVNIQKDIDKSKYHKSYSFYEKAIKLPVWASQNDLEIVTKYIQGFKKVSDVILNKPEIFINL